MRFPRLAWCAVLLFLALLGCGRGKEPAPKPLLAIQGQGFFLQCDPAWFAGGLAGQEPRLTMAEIGTDIPVDNAPARVKFALSPSLAKGLQIVPAGEATLRIIPLADPGVPDFAEAYPALHQDASELSAILKAGALRPEIGRDLPDWNCVDCEETIHAKAGILDTPWCSGIQFLTTYVQEASEIRNEGLVYKFEGLSKDGAYFVAAEIPLEHPSLPIPAPGIADMPRDKVREYYALAEAQLTGAGDDTFSPPLSVLREVIRSLRPARPTEGGPR